MDTDPVGGPRELTEAVAHAHGRALRDATRAEPEVAPGLPSLGAGYDVIDRVVSPTGDLEAVATFREDQPPVVLVRDARTGTTEVVWSGSAAPKAGRRNLPWPITVAWAPDSSRIALVVARERGPVDGEIGRTDLSLVIVDRDGSDLQVVEPEAGTCWCVGQQPLLTWRDPDRLDVAVPGGQGRVRHTVELPE